jgi:hypothetical protein
MSKSKSTSMTRVAASRIASATNKGNGGKIPAKSFASRADAGVQRVAAAGPKGAQGVKR